MRQQLPVTIHKTVWGQIGIVLGALASIGLIMLGLSETFKSPWADPWVMLAISVLVVGLVAAFFIIWRRV